jgi:hypothetical protein
MRQEIYLSQDELEYSSFTTLELDHSTAALDPGKSTVLYL